MSAEQAQSKETLGIQVPLSRTIIMSTFLHSNRGPHGEENYVDAKLRRTAIWLTTPEPSTYVDRIIGQDGLASPIGVIITEDGPHFGRFISDDAGYEPIPAEVLPDIQYVNLPEGEVAYTVLQRHPNAEEAYTVFQVPPMSGEPAIADFAPFIGKYQLISGVSNRTRGNRFATAALAMQLTDRKFVLPFGGELRPPKPPGRKLFRL